MHVVVGSMRIGARNYNHSKFARAGDEFTERIGLAEPLATMVERNFSGIVSNAATGTETDSVRPCFLEIIEPEMRIKLTWIVFNQRELGPAHGAVEPFRRIGGGGGSGG